MKTFFRLLKWAVVIILAIVTVGYGAIQWQANSRMYRVYDIPVEEVQVEFDSASLANGEHIIMTRGCNDCHGKNLEGRVFIDEMPLGRLIAPNLTPAESGLKNWKTEDYVRAIKHGLEKDNTPLFVMPSQEYQFSKSDLGDLIAYLQRLEPIENALPDHDLTAFTKALFLAGKLPLLPVELIDHEYQAPEMVATVASTELGAYIAKSCTGCHRPDFKGGESPIPGGKTVANITASGNVGKWTVEEFKTVLRTGKTPDGRQLDNRNMPWEITKNYNDVEIEAIYAYLKSI
jgi:mono/diheme cytochrome c family protein